MQSGNLSDRERIASTARENGWEFSGQDPTVYSKCAAHVTVGYSAGDQVSWARGKGFHVPAGPREAGTGKVAQVIDYLCSDFLSDGRCTLLAMSYGGEVMLVEDQAGDTWLVSIHQPDKRVSNASEYAARADLMHVGRAFESWQGLNAYRHENGKCADPRFPRYADYTAADVRAALRDTRTAEDPDEIAAAQGALERILEASSVVQADAELRAAVTLRIGELRVAGAECADALTESTDQAMIDEG